jgi:hypothetical protein
MRGDCKHGVIRSHRSIRCPVSDDAVRFRTILSLAATKASTHQLQFTQSLPALPLAIQVHCIFSKQAPQSTCGERHAETALSITACCRHPNH